MSDRVTKKRAKRQFRHRVLSLGFPEPHKIKHPFFPGPPEENPTEMSERFPSCAYCHNHHADAGDVMAWIEEQANEKGPRHEGAAHRFIVEPNAESSP
jgi:hypothetical protein